MINCTSFINTSDPDLRKTAKGFAVVPKEEVAVICTLICSAEFSPFRLALGVNNIDGLIAWAHFLLENLNISENLKDPRSLPRKIPWDFKQE